MATIIDSLKAVSSYPVPPRTLAATAAVRGLLPEDEATAEALRGRDYLLARADLLMWLSAAPNVTQGGQSYSFTDEQRRQMRRDAKAVYDELEPQAASGCVSFGYKGDRL